MVHGATGLTPNEAHKDENSIEVKAESVMKERYLRNYPEAGDDVRVLLKVKVVVPGGKKAVVNGARKCLKLRKLIETYK